MRVKKEIFLISEKIRRGEISRELIEYVDGDEQPLGLSFSDLFHSLDADRRIGLTGENVLEIGGALPCSYALEFLNVTEWTSIEYGDYVPPSRNSGLGNQGPRTIIVGEHPKYHYYSCKAHEFEPISNDAIQYTRVYSVAAFEHIGNLLVTLEHIARYCTHNSLLYAYFTPIWSDPLGHHLGQEILDMLGPWGHLLNSPQQMRQWLLAQGRHHREVDSIIYNVYKDPHISRNMPSDYELIFKNSSWKPIEIEPINKIQLNQLPNYISKGIAAHFPLETYLCSGYRLVSKLVK